MALFGTSRSFIGLDIGTSSLKVVELLDRRRRFEVVTYAQATIPNLLLHPEGTDDDEIQQLATIISRLLDAAGVTSDVVIAALPSSIVFSTVLTLPDVPDADMDKAVHFAARDVVPANLDEMVLGWSRVGQPPHMDQENVVPQAPVQPNVPTRAASNAAVPVFVTAAPKDVVGRYTRLIELLTLELLALEVETFPLARSLLGTPTDTAMIVDIGDRVTTFHIIDRGTPRVSQTVDYGGREITLAIAQALSLSVEQAEEKKMAVGLAADSAQLGQVTEVATEKLTQQARQLLQLYQRKVGRSVPKTVLIGGGANLRGIAPFWAQAVGHTVTVGNPWKGLAFPQALESRLLELGPFYAVAVGLAQRGFVLV